ncbi:MAG: LPS assembly protein LptD [Devosia sp.]
MTSPRSAGLELGRRARHAAAAFVLFVLLASPAGAALLPAGFFDQHIEPGSGPAAVEADRLSFDSRSSVISADGGVVLRYQGYLIHAGRLSFNQKTGALTASGGVSVRDPKGDTYEADSLEVTGGVRDAVIRSLTLTTSEGAVITADDVRYSDAMTAELTRAAYSPCGLCEDSKGRKIGWSVKAARIIYDHDKGSVTLEQPTLALLGIPVAWLPWISLPDPTQPRHTGFRLPSIDGDGKRGVVLTVPFFFAAGDNLDILLSPQLLTRQGLLLKGDATWRFGDSGEVSFSASGLRQFTPSAFAGTVGDRDWRGAIQTSGHFKPLADWTAGWSLTAFTDNAYLPDYKFNDDDFLANEIYATHLSANTWFDIRVSQFRHLGNYDATDNAGQALLLPQTSFEHVQDLAPGWGRLHFSGELIDVSRSADQTAQYPMAPGVPYVFGNEGTKQHLMLEGAWEDQFIGPAGVAFTPYLGGRLDAANYDRTLGAIGAPYPTTADSMLLSATPIAALDVRWPLVARNGADTHLFEPIAQIVYRGSSTTQVGITNDDAQSFVFDDTNIFSYNRFSGIDRQETGLRANIGAHYLANFADGGWLDLIAGQSFQLAGLNAFGVSDPVQVGTSTGLGGNASFIVAGARGGFSNGLTLGGKVQIDPATPKITRAGVGIDFAPGAHLVSTGLDYIFVAADPALGIATDQHEIAGRVSVPVADYWSINAGTTYDLAANNWLKANVGATYDDGYLSYGASANATPTSWGVGVTLNLKGPDGGDAF